MQIFSFKLRISLIISFSDSSSRALVASSRIKILGLNSKALAITILCLCPPDNRLPLLPIMVFSFFGKFLTNLCNLACTFCFQDRKKNPNRMNFEDWKKFINEIPENSRITLTGGEPLVFKEFDGNR